ncbi:MAG: AAA family ATPase [Pseudomonadales bacterium]|nr:hypothetical protein [Gammaproteobacteria bacterium]MDP6027038.1 AAA family ATPase [Pseudomonadales bacterium]MDP6317544.1 AAA family ATPase [Pseudomonadales bacterium]MDP7314693.1 AAA family ATPase [Pseudomonadales bacterium]MDP7577672.1 AAA family ATPase [Pseudomonadales bacterium]
MPAGTTIFLNGTSSAGKTTLAHALQERLDQPYIHIALDQFRDGLPDKYRGLNAPENTTGDRGLNVVPVTDGSKPYTDIRFGEDGQTMLRGMRRAMLAMVVNGNNIVIDDIILRQAYLTDYVEVFRSQKVIFVGVHCPRDVINQRESTRPGRFPGTAIGHFDVCHQHKIYDVEVDTSTMKPAECADAVLAFILNGTPHAFEELRAMNG